MWSVNLRPGTTTDSPTACSMVIVDLIPTTRAAENTVDRLGIEGATDLFWHRIRSADWLNPARDTHACSVPSAVLSLVPSVAGAKRRGVTERLSVGLCMQDLVYDINFCSGRLLPVRKF